ncbi:MAG: hybrid sensor histidine kinase/response regulator [Bacteroidota bacterium]
MVGNQFLILVVDDNPKNLQILSAVLYKEGYTVLFASNGKQALDMAQNQVPDLILLDINLPDIDGFEVCKKLKQNSLTKDIPIMFITGRIETEDIVLGFKVGAVDYITKPFNIVELLSRVGTHLNLKRSRDEVVRYSKELEKTQAELKQAIAQRDKFFSIIAHDLRGPFTGFIGLSELLVDAYDSLERADIQQIANSMNSAAKKLFEFLENLLEWSRSQIGGLQYNPIIIDVHDLFDRVSSLFKDTANNKKIEFVKEIQDDLFIWADNYQTNTILRNLVSNAIKFSYPNSKIILGARDIGDSVEIYVKDFGVGISDEAKDKVFRIEAKYTTPGTENEPGTGLGLVLCKELAEKQNGVLYFETEKNKGTTFFVKLPKPTQNHS